MNISKPGQLCTINNVVYRAKSRTNGCTGCALDGFFTCPNITDCRSNSRPIKCSLNDIILVRV